MKNVSSRSIVAAHPIIRMGRKIDECDCVIHLYSDAHVGTSQNQPGHGTMFPDDGHTSVRLNGNR